MNEIDSLDCLTRHFIFQRSEKKICLSGCDLCKKETIFSVWFASLLIGFVLLIYIKYIWFDRLILNGNLEHFTHFLDGIFEF